MLDARARRRAAGELAIALLAGGLAFLASRAAATQSAAGAEHPSSSGSTSVDESGTPSGSASGVDIGAAGSASLVDGASPSGSAIPPRSLWFRPERLGHKEALTGLGGLVSPFLAGFSLTTIAVLVTADHPPKLASPAILALAAAASLLLYSMQVSFLAVEHAATPADWLAWYPEATVNRLSLNSIRKRQAREQGRTLELERRCAATYEFGLLCFLAGLGLIVWPIWWTHNFPTWHCLAVAVVGMAFVVEVWWMVARRYNARHDPDLRRFWKWLKERRAQRHQLDGKSEAMVDLFEKLDVYGRGFGPTVTLRIRKRCFRYFRRECAFFTMKVKREHVLLRLRMVSSPAVVGSRGHYGTYDVVYSLRSADKLDEARHLIKQAYDKQPAQAREEAGTRRWFPHPASWHAAEYVPIDPATPTGLAGVLDPERRRAAKLEYYPDLFVGPEAEER